MASTSLKEKLQRQLRYEINNKIRQLELECNQNIVKLKLIKKLMNINNVFCVFRFIIDNQYVNVQLYELDELLNPYNRVCEAKLATSVANYAIAI